MIDTSKTVTGVMVNGTSMNVGGGGGGGSSSMQTFIDLRNNTDDGGTILGCSYLFFNMASLTNATLSTIMSGVDTSEVVNWMGCFLSTGITAIPDLDYSSAEDCSEMFSGSEITEAVGLNIPNIFYSSYMFSGCINLVEVGFEAGTTDNLVNIDGMFEGCSSLTGVEFDATNVISASFTFLDCSSLNYVVLNGITVDFDISASEEFSANDLAITIANLGETGGATATLTMGATNLAKLSQDDIDNAEAKGWTLA